MEHKVVKKLVDIFIAPFLRLEIVGHPQLPADEGALLAVNHIHALDPVIISYVMYPKWLYHLAKEEIFRHPLIGPLVRNLGAIPVNRRRPGAESIRRILERLRKKSFVCIFPQGTRRRTDFGEIKKGVARMALSCGVSIYPVAITGLEKVKLLGLLRRPKVKIVFGEPISVAGRQNTREEVDALTVELHEHMTRLYQQLTCKEPELH